ncbi:hypothetical protein HHUSO_G8490 [Huso huso]|uniref:Uncharacterized protein n=1 Tax=Huso huso TaxID=61971 RepID=A0ABR0ZRA6_HUSHU
MDCMLSVQNKRRHEVEDLGEWENLNQPTKRFCGGLESCIQFDNAAANDQLGECPMDTWNMQQPVSSHDPRSKTANQHSSMVYANGSGSVQPCLRCMAGESGHINHIVDF